MPYNPYCWKCNSGSDQHLPNVYWKLSHSDHFDAEKPADEEQLIYEIAQNHAEAYLETDYMQRTGNYSMAD